MRTLIVVNNPKDWPLEIADVEIVPAKAYLTDQAYSRLTHTKVFNLCRSYGYQTNGYYVSLLAEARGHKPLPNVPTLLDMKSPSMVRFVSDDLDEIIQKTLASIRSEKFTLSIYFGKNLAKHHARLSQSLFKLFPAPFVRAQFKRSGTDRWQLLSVGPIAANDIPADHRPFVIEVAREYFAGKRLSGPRRKSRRFDIAMLYNPALHDNPSDEKAMQKFARAAESLDFDVEFIGKDDYGWLAEFDALFIRETTNVNHHTYRFARRAAAEGLVVVDDPESILKCTNKVYLAELLSRNKVLKPKTRIMHHVDQIPDLVTEFGLPMILKQPDSAFSIGVVKVDDEAELHDAATRMLETSELIIVQQFLPTPYDWRIGVFDGVPLYACKYHMAGNHWQIIDHSAPSEKSRFGDVETLPVESAPDSVVKAALRASALIGDGLYGVDLKERNGRAYIIEVNDNPSIDAGYEDAVLKDALYESIMKTMLQRVERQYGVSKEAV